MDTKKYGVSLSSLKSLQEFQLALKDKRNKRLETPFQGECLVTIDDNEPERLCVYCANPAVLSIEGMGVIFLKNKVKSIVETDTEVVIECKEHLFCKEVLIRFENSDSKTHFITSLGNLLENSSDESDDLDGGSTPDSGP